MEAVRPFVERAILFPSSQLLIDFEHAPRASLNASYAFEKQVAH
jgi:hypothetical protein